MKKYFLLYKILLLSLPGFAQLTISPGAHWVNSGNAAVVLQDMDFVNDGSLSSGTGSFKFTGTQNTAIKGASMPVFNILEVAKANNAKILLNRNISVGSSINFISGLLDLNSSNIVLAPSAYLAGESDDTRITGASGGFVEITQNLNAPLLVNPGNLGAMLTSSANLGLVTVRRGHTVQSGTGLTAGIQRYFYITPQNNSGLNTTLRFKYFNPELNGQNENILVSYQSDDNGARWTNLSQTTRNTNINYVEKTGLNNLSLHTLANDVSAAPVTGLVFNAKRKKPTEAELTWTTALESNMSGFEVQRKQDNEAEFTPRTFVNSLAPGGNSASPLSYLYNDPNSYTGISYYRLKIVDQANNISYSDIKTVTGKGKKITNDLLTVTGEEARRTFAKETHPVMATEQKITVGPNPNNGNFWFTVSGIEKETIASLYTIDGKLVKQFRVINHQRQQVGGLRSGIYLLKMPGLDVFKIIVQGSSNGAVNKPQAASPVIKD